MEKMIRLAPVFKQMIWGGSRMRTVFGYDIPGDDTGECWAVSAHKNGDCPVVGGEFDGKTLSWLWENEQELFGSTGCGGQGDPKRQVFPLLTKIIDARRDLSIQVHPDDRYAMEHENGSLGKTECWYILDCIPGATIVMGHNAKDRAELEDMIRNGRWAEFIREVPIKKGDFLQIYPGTVHAIKGGTMILETQQNSDVTYRVYDYDRLQNGRLRQLHIQQSIDVITVPFAQSSAADRGEPLTRADLSGSTAAPPASDGSVCTPLIRCECYQVWKLDVDGSATYLKDRPFMLCSVIEGGGVIRTEGRSSDTKSASDEIRVKKGDHFILTAACREFWLGGSMSLICSSVT